MGRFVHVLKFQLTRKTAGGAWWWSRRQGIESARDCRPPDGEFTAALDKSVSSPRLWSSVKYFQWYCADTVQFTLQSVDCVFVPVGDVS